MAKNITVTFEDGTSHIYQGAPDTVTPEDITARAQKEFNKNVTALDGGNKPTPLTLMQQMQAASRGDPNITLKDVGLGAVRGAAGIGGTLAKPLQAMGVLDNNLNVENIDSNLARDYGANPSSIGYKGGKLASEMAITAPTGGLLSKGLLKVAPEAVDLAKALEASGFAKNVGWGKNAIAGGVTGLATANLLNPGVESSLIGAGLGAGSSLVGSLATPVVQAVAAKMGNKKAIAARAEAELQRLHPSDKDFYVNALQNINNGGFGSMQTAGETVAEHNLNNPGAFKGGELIARQGELTGGTGAGDSLNNALEMKNQAMIDAQAAHAGGHTLEEQAQALKTANDFRAANSGKAYSALNNTIVKSDNNLDTLLSSPAMQKLMPIAKDIHGNELAAAKVKGETLPTFMIPKTEATGITYDPYTGAAIKGKPSAPTEYSIGTLQTLKSAIDKAATDKSVAAQYGIDAASLTKVGGVRDQLNKWLENASSEWASARAAYKAESAPINQLEINQELYRQLKNSSGNITPSNYLTATERGMPQLLKKSGVPRFATKDDISNALTSDNMDTINAIRNQLQVMEKYKSMGGKLGNSGLDEKIAPGMIVPHIAPEATITDSLLKMLRYGGDNVKRAVSETLTDPQRTAQLIKGIPDSKKAIVIKSLIANAPVTGANAALAKQLRSNQ